MIGCKYILSIKRPIIIIVPFYDNHANSLLYWTSITTQPNANNLKHFQMLLLEAIRLDFGKLEYSLLYHDFKNPRYVKWSYSVIISHKGQSYHIDLHKNKKSRTYGTSDPSIYWFREVTWLLIGDPLGSGSGADWEWIHSFWVSDWLREVTWLWEGIRSQSAP